MNEYDKFEVVITAIIVNSEGKYLITRRSKQKRRFPGMWTVPGGHLDAHDFSLFPKETEHYWYNILEKALKREIQEEVGVEIDNVLYVTSLGTIHVDGAPSLVISVMADYVSGNVKLQEEETDLYAWVSLEDAKDFKLIDGIYDELAMTEQRRKGEKVEWQRFETASQTGCYSSPKVEVRESATAGKGVFANEHILKDELIFDFSGGLGDMISTQEAHELYKSGNDYMIQVDDNLFFAATADADVEPCDYLNHSCDPNAGIKGRLKIVAMRDMLPNEEISFDYAMSESSDMAMECKCGKLNCRKKITGDDWKLPELQKKYSGYFSEYLQGKLAS